MRIQPRYAPVYKDASVLLRPKTGLKDMVAELTPGTEAAGRLEEGGVIPVSQTLPDVNLDEILAALDSDTRDYLLLLLNDGAAGLGSEAQGPRARAGDPAASSRPRSTRARSTRASPSGGANLARVVHNFSLLTDELGKRDTQLANFVQNSNAVFATLAEQDTSLRAILQKLPGTLQTHADVAGQGRDARRRARADARVAAAGGAGAGAVAAPDAAVPARVDADHPRRDPPVHARGAADGEGAAPGDARPGGGHAGPDGVVQGRQPAAEHGRLQPARRRRRASCSGSRGSTTPATRSSPPRTRTARSGAAWSCCPARPRSCWTPSRRPTRSSAR